jgi:hypothetical protein
MVQAVRTSETSVNFNVIARRHILEDSYKLHTRRRENLKFHTAIIFLNIPFITENRRVFFEEGFETLISVVLKA